MQIFSYISPDQMLPLATPLAMAAGFVMMFGRTAAKSSMNFAKRVFNRGGLVAVAEQSGEELPGLPFPQYAAASQFVEQHQNANRAA